MANAKLIVPLAANYEDVATSWGAVVQDDLLYVNFFNLLAYLDRNLARDIYTTSEVVGSPVVTDEYVSLNDEAHIDTGIPQESDSFTYIVVVKPSVDLKDIFVIGNYKGGTAAGAWLYLDDNGTEDGTLTARFGSVHGGAAKLTSTGVLAVDTPYAFAVRYDATTLTKTLFSLTTGTQATTVLTTEMDGPSANTILLGSSYTSSTDAMADLYTAMIYGAALTDDQIATQYAQIKSTMAINGVAV